VVLALAGAAGFGVGAVLRMVSGAGAATGSAGRRGATWTTGAGGPSRGSMAQAVKPTTAIRMVGSLVDISIMVLDRKVKIMSS
jgi:hypothetical protein